MTDKEIIGILKESSLWQVLSDEERNDAVSYALDLAARRPMFKDEDEDYLFNAISNNYSYYLSAIDGLE
jgi:hypothetical protein